MENQIEILKTFGVLVLVTNKNDKIAIFATKENKRKKIGMDILANGYVKTEEGAINVLNNIIEKFKQKEEKKQKTLEAKEAFDIKKEYAIGTILYNSWGWEQTNINFYKVIGHKGTKTLVIVEIASTVVEYYNDMSGTKKPNPDKVISEPFTKQVIVKENYNYINFNSYSVLSKCDEKHLTEGLYFSNYY
jgi:hypothetical protein